LSGNGVGDGRGSLLLVSRKFVCEGRGVSGPSQFVCKALKKIRAIAEDARKDLECQRGKFEALSGNKLDDAIDEAQNTATESDTFLELVNDIMVEIAKRFSAITEGEPVKSSTGCGTRGHSRCQAVAVRNLLVSYAGSVAQRRNTGVRY